MFMYEADVYTAIFIFNLCVWASEMRNHIYIYIYNVKTAYGVTEQISVIIIVALFVCILFF
jgi:hypothetical protein